MPESNLATNSQAEFDQLQKKLVPLWKSIERFNQDPQTIVVVPSMSIDAISSGAVMQAYEERFLFLLLLLRQPPARCYPKSCAAAAFPAFTSRRIGASTERQASLAATADPADPFFGNGSRSRAPCSF